jgi:hypothetical protein
VLLVLVDALCSTPAGEAISCLSEAKVEVIVVDCEGGKDGRMNWMWR